jgi:hypothetical protein
VEVDLLRMIEGRVGDGGNWDMRIHHFILFYSVLSRSIEIPSRGRTSRYKFKIEVYAMLQLEVFIVQHVEQ